MLIPSHPSVIALGEALVEIMRGSQEQPLGDVGTFYGPFPSGAPAIFADACSRLGLHTGFIGTIGDDAFGRAFQTRLLRDNVDLAHMITDRSRATGVAFVGYARDGSREFVFHLRDAAAGQVPDVPDAYFENARWLHIAGSTLTGSVEWRAACIRAARLARQAGARVSFDPNIRPSLLDGSSVIDVCQPIVALADVVLPSSDELQHITGIADREPAIQTLFTSGVKLVVIKHGHHGSTAYTPEATIRVPAFSVEEVDPTGAGDAFAAGLAYGLLDNMPLGRALALANEVGALAVTRLGPMEGLPSLLDVSSARV
jgi:sugar/nucleoside kinase (ribokinase family)